MSLLNAIGNTPLFELSKLQNLKNNVKIYAKAEFLNVSGSVKDRAAKAMILDGIKSGALSKDKTIIDATSGNTGIAYSIIGAALDYRVKLCMPANVTAERKRLMHACGAEIIETDPMEGIDGAYLKTKEIVEKNPNLYFYPDQYSNNENWKAHYNTTAVEILRQTDNKVTHFVAGTGTSGTFMGCTRRLKEYRRDIKCFTMTPDSPFHGIEGVKHTSAVLHSGFFDFDIADGSIEISTEQAYEITRRLAKVEGIFAGISSGANVAAALKIAENAPPNSVIVTVLCDNGCRYLSEHIWC